MSVSAQIFIQLFVDVHGILNAPYIIYTGTVAVKLYDELLKFSDVAER